MIERIHQATRKILAAEGLEFFSSKRIAKQAGLSLGSLYQYYPNRQLCWAILKASYNPIFKASKFKRKVGIGVAKPYVYTLNYTTLNKGKEKKWHLYG
jgi:AcrR family transcriptional regulator